MKEKKNTLDKFMVTRLNIKNSKNKVVTLPTGEQVTIPVWAIVISPRLKQ